MRKTDEGYELSAAELNAIIWIFVILETQIRRDDNMLKPLARAGGVAINYGAFKHQGKKALEGMLQIVTRDQRVKLNRTLKARSAMLVMKNRALHGMEDLREITDSDMGRLIDWARAWFGCDLCMKDAKAAKKCELRKMLLGIMPPVEHDEFSCEYGV